jgi:hypothetical protein
MGISNLIRLAESGLRKAYMRMIINFNTYGHQPQKKRQGIARRLQTGIPEPG